MDHNWELHHSLTDLHPYQILLHTHIKVVFPLFPWLWLITIRLVIRYVHSYVCPQPPYKMSYKKDSIIFFLGTNKEHSFREEDSILTTNILTIVDNKLSSHGRLHMSWYQCKLQLTTCSSWRKTRKNKRVNRYLWAVMLTRMVRRIYISLWSFEKQACINC